MQYLIITQEKKSGNAHLGTFVVYKTKSEAERFCKVHSGEFCRVYTVSKGALAGPDGHFEMIPLDK